MADETRFCTHCRYAKKAGDDNRRWTSDWWLCQAPQAQRANLVTGEPQAPSCSTERMSGSGCGSNGAFWAPSDEAMDAVQSAAQQR